MPQLENLFPMLPESTVTLLSAIRTSRIALAFYPAARMYSSMLFSVVIAMFYRAAVRQDAYNMLWAILFGFATLNILGLAARRMEPRRGLSLGEVMAVLTLVLSMFLLGWEMLKMFHFFPIKLK